MYAIIRNKLLELEYRYEKILVLIEIIHILRNKIRINKKKNFVYHAGPFNPVLDRENNSTVPKKNNSRHLFSFIRCVRKKEQNIGI